MAHFVGLDVLVKATSVCVVDDVGTVILEQKVPTEPADIIALLTSLGVAFFRVGRRQLAVVSFSRAQTHEERPNLAEHNAKTHDRFAPLQKV